MKQPKEITLKQFTKKIDSIFKDTTDNKSQYIIEGPDDKRAIMIDFDEFTEFMFAVEDMMTAQDYFDHDFAIEPLVNKLLEDEEHDNQFLIDLILHSHIEEETANAFLNDAISEEEFLITILNDPLNDEYDDEDEDLDHGLDPIVARFIDEMDDDLFDILINATAPQELVKKLAYNEISTEEFVTALKTESSKH